MSTRFLAAEKRIRFGKELGRFAGDVMDEGGPGRINKEPTK
jgi:hypothetical protein